jgi:tetratricopeptide (TPR) repeat protein
MEAGRLEEAVGLAASLPGKASLHGALLRAKSELDLADGVGGLQAFSKLEAAGASLAPVPGSGLLRKKIHGRMADLGAREAELAWEAGNRELALRLLEKALAVEPSHAGAERVLAKLRAGAEALFYEGYALKEHKPEEARKKLRLVLRLSRPGEDLHARARKWLEALGDEGR